MLIAPGYARIAVIPLTLTLRQGRMLGVMFSIGEFAQLGGISVRALRHYDETSAPGPDSPPTDL